MQLSTLWSGVRGMSVQVWFLFSASISLIIAWFHSGDALASLMFRGNVWADTWRAYLWLGHLTFAWDLVTMVWAGRDCCGELSHCEAEESSILLVEELRGWPTGIVDQSEEFPLIRPSRWELGDSSYSRLYSSAIGSECNFALSEKSFSTKMTSHDISIFPSIELKHRYPFTLSKYPRNIWGEVWFVFLLLLNGRVFGLARHLNTLKSLIFGAWSYSF